MNPIPYFSVLQYSHSNRLLHVKHGPHRSRHYRQWHFCQGAAHCQTSFFSIQAQLLTSHPQPAILKCDLLSLKAIFSRSAKSAEAAAALLPFKPDLYAEDAGDGRALADLLARADVSAIVVALPIPSQPSFVRAALAAGKHVLAEKPVAKDVATAQELIAYASSEAVRRTGATLSVAENQRYFPRFAYALAQAAGRDLGRVTHFSIRW